jgi:hypothetical protein
LGGEPLSPSEGHLKQTSASWDPEFVMSARSAKEALSCSCRMSETPKVARRRPRLARKGEAFGDTKTENASRRCHVCHVLEAAACQHLIGGQQGGVLV